jgi:hypothetical protein
MPGITGALLPTPDEAIVPHGKPAPNLGSGFSSTLRRPMGQLIYPIDDYESQPNYHTKFHFELADDRSSFAQEIALNARAKFDFSGGGASTRASMSQSFRKSERSLFVVGTKFVLMEQQHLRDPRWRQEAIHLISHNSENFIQRYGDWYIKSVQLGGLLSIIYTLNFSDMDQASDFQGSFELREPRTILAFGDFCLS